MAKLTVSKQITRKISTAQFENVDVHCGFEQEIEYQTEGELQEKIKVLTDKLLEQVDSDLAYITDALGVEEKRIFVKSARPNPLR